MLSCSNKQSDNSIISEDVFTNVYADLQIAKEEAVILAADSVYISHKADSIYSAYHVTGKQVESTLQSYKNDLPGWKLFQERVIKRLESLQKLPTADSANKLPKVFN